MGQRKELTELCLVYGIPVVMGEGGIGFEDYYCRRIHKILGFQGEFLCMVVSVREPPWEQSRSSRQLLGDANQPSHIKLEGGRETFIVARAVPKEWLSDRKT